MSDEIFVLAKITLSIGAFIIFVVWQLVTLKRDKAKTRAQAEDRSAEAISAHPENASSTAQKANSPSGV